MEELSKGRLFPGYILGPIQPRQRGGLVQHPLSHGASQPDEEDVCSNEADCNHRDAGLPVSVYACKLNI